MKIRPVKFVDMSEDDEVIIVPYVKPTPPMIVLSESEDECEGGRGSVRPQSRTKESGSHREFSGDSRVRRNVPSPIDIEEMPGYTERAENENFQAQSITQGSKSIFDPSETAMMDVPSKQTTPSVSLDSTPVPSPTSGSGNGKKSKGLHSNIVKQQFDDFLKGINLPPAPAGRKTKPRTSDHLTGKANGELNNNKSSTVPSSPAVEVVTVTVEKSTTPTSKRTKIRKSSSTIVSSSSQATQGKRRDDSVVMDIQFNLTTMDKGKGTKRSKSSTSKEARENSTSKKRRGEESSSTKTKTKRKLDKTRVTKVKQSSSKNQSEPTPEPDTPSLTDVPIIPITEVSDVGMPNHWTDEMKQFYGTLSSKPFKLSEIMAKQSDHSKHWQIMNPVSFRNRRRSESCEICKKYTHRTHNCPQRGCPMKCVYCGNRDHTKDGCPEGICLFCGSTRGAVVRTCSMCLDRRPKIICCELCGVKGHDKKLCPDNWRKYHSTTIDIEKVTEELSNLKSKLRRKKKLLEASKTSGSSKFGFKTTSEREIRVLEKERKVLEDKLANAVSGNSSKVGQYVPMYKQCCSNCGSKGHAYINCSKPLPWWVPRHMVIPNKPYVVKELEKPSMSSSAKTSKRKEKETTSGSKSLETTPSTSTKRTETVKGISKTARATSSEKQSPRVISASADDTVTTITVSNENSQPERTELINERGRVRHDTTPRHAISLSPNPDSSRTVTNQETNDEVTSTITITVANESLVAEEVRNSEPIEVAPTVGEIVMEDVQPLPNFKAPPAPPPIMTRSTDLQHQFYEDVLPMSFDLDERQGGMGLTGMPLQPPRSVGFQPPPFAFPPPQQQIHLSHPLFSVPPPPPNAQFWQDGCGRIQPPFSTSRIPEFIQIPVPIPVPAEDFARYQREGGFPFQAYFQSLNFCPPNELSSIPFPPPSIFNRTIPVREPIAMTQPVQTTHAEDPPSPDSTETPMNDAPASPDVVFVEEVQKNISPQTMTKPQEKGEDDSKICLLRSEWDLFIRDKGKCDLVEMLSRKLGVKIKVCKETMSVTISGQDESAKAISKRNIVDFLQQEAAGMKFVPNLERLPCDLPEITDRPTLQNDGTKSTPPGHQRGRSTPETSRKSGERGTSSSRYRDLDRPPRETDQRYRADNQWNEHVHNRDYRRNYVDHGQYHSGRQNNMRYSERRDYNSGRGGYGERSYRGGSHYDNSRRYDHPPRPLLPPKSRRYFES